MECAPWFVGLVVLWERRALREGSRGCAPGRAGRAAIHHVTRPAALVPGLGIPSRYGPRRPWVIGLVDPHPARPFSNTLALFELARRRRALREYR